RRRAVGPACTRAAGTPGPVSFRENPGPVSIGGVPGPVPIRGQLALRSLLGPPRVRHEPPQIEYDDYRTIVAKFDGRRTMGGAMDTLASETAQADREVAAHPAPGEPGI